MLETITLTLPATRRTTYLGENASLYDSYQQQAATQAPLFRNFDFKQLESSSPFAHHRAIGARLPRFLGFIRDDVYGYAFSSYGRKQRAEATATTTPAETAPAASTAPAQTSSASAATSVAAAKLVYLDLNQANPEGLQWQVGGKVVGLQAPVEGSTSQFVFWPKAFHDMQAFTEARTETQPDLVVTLEHMPVFTQGIAGKADHLLTASDIPVVQADRGGQITYHGPGQLMVYLMLDFARLQKQAKPTPFYARDLVTMMESATVSALSALGLEHVHAKPTAPGIYVGQQTKALELRQLVIDQLRHDLRLDTQMDKDELVAAAVAANPAAKYVVHEYVMGQLPEATKDMLASVITLDPQEIKAGKLPALAESAAPTQAQTTASEALGKTAEATVAKTEADAHNPDFIGDAGKDGARKVASLGLKVTKKGTYHGIAINVNTELTPFSYINPCGYEGLHMANVQDYVNPVVLWLAGYLDQERLQDQFKAAVLDVLEQADSAETKPAKVAPDGVKLNHLPLYPLGSEAKAKDARWLAQHTYHDRLRQHNATYYAPGSDPLKVHFGRIWSSDFSRELLRQGRLCNLEPEFSPTLLKRVRAFLLADDYVCATSQSYTDRIATPNQVDGFPHSRWLTLERLTQWYLSARQDDASVNFDQVLNYLVFFSFLPADAYTDEFKQAVTTATMEFVKAYFVNYCSAYLGYEDLVSYPLC